VISRAQLWQWRRHGATLDDGRAVTADLYRQVREEELTMLGGPGAAHFGAAADILDSLVLDDDFAEFLTLPAYRLVP
jgi:malate synthase